MIWKCDDYYTVHSVTVADNCYEEVAQGKDKGGVLTAVNYENSNGEASFFDISD